MLSNSLCWDICMNVCRPWVACCMPSCLFLILFFYTCWKWDCNSLVAVCYTFCVSELSSLMNKIVFNREHLRVFDKVNSQPTKKSWIFGFLCISIELLNVGAEGLMGNVLSLIFFKDDWGDVGWLMWFCLYLVFFFFCWRNKRNRTLNSFYLTGYKFFPLALLFWIFYCMQLKLNLIPLIISIIVGATCLPSWCCNCTTKW